jgi:hypothetical protein
LLPRHSLSARLHKVLEAVDAVHAATNLKQVTVVMDRRVKGGLFYAYSDTGPYSIYLSPTGTHPELSLLHEIGHLLEWQCIPKEQPGVRDFAGDLRFAAWLRAVYETQTVQHFLTLLEDQPEGTQEVEVIGYLLRVDELWSRAYCQFIANRTRLDVLFQQIAAENKQVAGTMTYKSYWDQNEFVAVQDAMNKMVEELEWTK